MVPLILGNPQLVVSLRVSILKSSLVPFNALLGSLCEPGRIIAGGAARGGAVTWIHFFF